MAKKKNVNYETVIDLANVNESQVRFDIDPDDLDKKPDEDDEDKDFQFPQEDFELELEEPEGSDDDEDEDEQPRKPKKVKKVELDDTTDGDTSKQEASEKVRKSAAQERIRELANKNKLALQEKLKSDAKNKELEEENIALKKRFADSDMSVAEHNLTQAKYAYAKAYEDNDAVAIAEANAKLSQASLQVEMAKMKKSQSQSLVFDEEAHKQRVLATQQELQNQPVEYAEAPLLDAKSQKWLTRNKFIFSNQGLTEAAGILFDQLKDDGYNQSEYETYKELEERMIALYPNTERLFKRKVKNEDLEMDDEDEVEVEEKPKKKVEAPPVANANRTQANSQQDNKGTYRVDSKGKVKYKPTREDVDMAKRMNVPIENYVKNKIRIERDQANGSKYTQIF